jgi:hypothetical protein
MKFSQSFKMAALAAALLLSVSAFAANVHKGTLEVRDPIQVNGKELKTGDYTVRWEGEGPAVNLQFILGGKAVATAQATVVPLDRKASDNTAEVKGTGKDRQLSAIRFSGQKYELDIANESAQAQGKSGETVK